MSKQLLLSYRVTPDGPQRRVVEQAPPDPIRPEGAGYVRYEDVYVSGDDLQQTLDRVQLDGAGNRQCLTFPEGEFLIPNNFVNGYLDGVRVSHPQFAGGCRGVAGSGPDTIFKMLSDNHERITSGNEKYALMAFNPPSSSRASCEFRNFTIQGTHLGKNGDLDFNGLRLNNANSGTVDNVIVRGNRGSMNIPPGETGSISTLNASYVTISNCEFDGLLDGERVRASGLLANKSDHLTVTNLDAHDNFCAMGGATFWNCTDCTVINANVYNMLVPGQSGYCFNFEESNRITYIDCTTIHGTVGGGFHYSLNSNADKGGPVNPVLTIKNPTWDAQSVGNGQLVTQTWGPADSQNAGVPPVVTDANGDPLPFYWANPFGIDRWINQ